MSLDEFDDRVRLDLDRAGSNPAPSMICDSKGSSLVPEGQSMRATSSGTLSRLRQLAATAVVL